MEEWNKSEDDLASADGVTLTAVDKKPHAKFVWIFPAENMPTHCDRSS